MERKIPNLEYVDELLEKYDNFFFDMDGVIVNLYKKHIY